MLQQHGMLRVRHELLRLTMKISSLDPTLFFWKCDGILAGIICLHVNDFVWSGTPKFHQDVIAHICIFAEFFVLEILRMAL